jgi:hypothetical protein
MPQIFLFVRFDATLPSTSKNTRNFDPQKPSIRAIDITTTGVPTEYMKANPTSLFPEPYKVTVPETDNIHTIACEVLNPGPITFEIITSSMSWAKAAQTFRQMQKYVMESDEERLEHYSEGVLGKAKAVVKFEGDTCAKIRLGERCVLWYEMLKIECQELQEEDGADAHGERKRVKLPMKGGKNAAWEEHEFADVDMEG